MEKKIITDEDWKAQVQEEKGQTAVSKTEERKERLPFPPASMPFLFSTLATQAFIAMGLVPNPISHKMETDLEQGKHFIDMLGVLEEKTKGNLTTEEKKQLDSLLFDLRLQYVEVSTKATGEKK